MLDIPLWHYFDFFIAAILANGYFIYKTKQDLNYASESQESQL